MTYLWFRIENLRRKFKNPFLKLEVFDGKNDQKLNVLCEKIHDFKKQDILNDNRSFVQEC